MALNHATLLTRRGATQQKKWSIPKTRGETHQTRRKDGKVERGAQREMF